MDASDRHHQTSTAAKIGLLRRHPLFDALSVEICERIATNAKTKSVPRGTMICAKGETGTSMFAILDGVVQVTAASSEGRSAVFNQLGVGEIVGEIALLDGRPRTADAIALTDCRFMIIERRDFLPVLRASPDVSIKLLEVLCGRLRRTSEQVEDLMFLDLKARLAKALLRLLPDAESDGAIAISQTDLSHIVGMSREMINKQLQAWARDGLIEIDRRRILVLQPGILVRVAAQD